MLKKSFVVLSLIGLPVFAAAPAKPAQPPAQIQVVSSSQLTQRMKDAIHVQISREQYSSNLYLTFACYFADLGLDGCEKFFRKASAEEQEHALLFFNHLIDRNEKFSMLGVDASALTPASVFDAFQKLYENEMKVTASIHNLYKIALEEKDYATQAFLQDFLLLQVEEEKEAQDLVQLLALGPNDAAYIIQFDTRLLEKLEED